MSVLLRAVKLMNGPANGLVLTLPAPMRASGEIRIKNGAVPTNELGYPLYRANPDVREYTDHGEDLYWYVDEKDPA
jgi:hypothetical protein